MNLKFYCIIFLLIGFYQVLFCQVDTNISDKETYFISMGTVKSIYYNSPNNQKDYWGFFSLQGGYLRRLSPQDKLVINVGFMRKGSFGTCDEPCPVESVFSLPIKVRLERQLFNNTFTYGIGTGLSMYVLNRDDQFDESNVLIEEGIYERRYGLGLDMVYYVNLDLNLKLGVNYNPNIYELTEKRFKYYHTLFLEFRYDIPNRGF